MKKFQLIFLFILIGSGITFALDIVYSINLLYSDGRLSLENVELIEGTAPDRTIQPDVGYTAKVISVDGKELYSFKFELPIQVARIPPLEAFNESGEQISIPRANESVTISSISFSLLIPYFENGKTIEVYNPQNTLELSVDISQFARSRPIGVEGLVFGIVIVAILGFVGFYLVKIKSPKKKRKK